MRGRELPSSPNIMSGELKRGGGGNSTPKTTALYVDCIFGWAQSLYKHKNHHNFEVYTYIIEFVTLTKH